MKKNGSWLKDPDVMTIRIIFSIISAASVAFLSYFGFALWKDSKRPPRGQRVLVLELKERFIRKKSRLLHMYKLDATRTHERTRKL
jgi:hypothetical protein